MKTKRKILFYTPAYLPKVGGLENVASALATYLVEQGYEVKVVCLTAGETQNLNHEVIRFPSIYELWKLVKWCDVFFHQNVSLKGVWPIFLLMRKFVILHHSTSIGFLGKVKNFISRFAHNISISEYVNQQLPKPDVVIHNSYNPDVFRKLNDVPRTKDLVFLGRLVSDKGCDVLLEALSVLATKNIRPALSIIGKGPEEERLKQLTEKYQLQGQVEFIGERKGEELVKELNKHKIMIIPSVWNEPFGIVALEGIACGCIVIGSEGGGLKEAIGPCGFTFKNSDVGELAEKIELVVSSDPKELLSEEEVHRHLYQHTINYIGRFYMEVID